MINRTLFLSVLTFGLVAACSSSSSSSSNTGSGASAETGTATVIGTIKGAGFTVADASAALEDTSSDGMAGSDLSIYITNYGGSCGLRQTASVKGGGLYVFLHVFSYNTTGKAAPPITARTYDFTGPDDSNPDGNGDAITGSVEVDGFDGSCAQNVRLQASKTAKSSITITDMNGVKGTYDVTLDNGDHLTGTFTAPKCDLSGVPKTLNQNCK